jgi:hypothetical protein
LWGFVSFCVKLQSTPSTEATGAAVSEVRYVQRGGMNNKKRQRGKKKKTRNAHDPLVYFYFIFSFVATMYAAPEFCPRFTILH